MNALTEEIKRFLESAGFEATALDQPPIVLTAQNEDLIVFVVDASAGLASAVESTLNRLIKPFTAKTFGPKTVELYAVFLCAHGVPLADIEQIEQNTMVCRKIVVSDADEIESRLSFLKPLDVAFTSSPEIDHLFWSKLAAALSPDDLGLVEALRNRDLSLKDFLERFPK
jgi:hypothetical protein